MKKLSLIAIVLSVAIASYAQDADSTRVMTKKEKKEARRQKVEELMRQAEEGVLIYSKQSILA